TPRPRKPGRPPTGQESARSCSPTTSPPSRRAATTSGVASLPSTSTGESTSATTSTASRSLRPSESRSRPPLPPRSPHRTPTTGDPEPMDTVRTPDHRFADLPDYPFAPHYAEIPDGAGGTLRMHYLDEGPSDAAPVLLLHGEPS